MVPPPANELRRKYQDPQEYKRLRDSWQRTIYALVSVRDRLDLQFSADEGASARVSIVVEHRRLYDPDKLPASIQPVLDSLVNLGLIRDDSFRLPRFVTVAQKKSPEMQTQIEITPITEDPNNAA